MNWKRIAPILLFVAAFAVPASAQKPKIKVTAATAHSVTLTWTQAVLPTPPAGTTYVCNNPPSGASPVTIVANSVYRSTTSGGEGGTPLAVLNPPATTYTDTSVAAATTYYYQVTATNCNGESGKSTEVSAAVPGNTQGGSLNPPTNVTVTAQ